MASPGHRAHYVPDHKSFGAFMLSQQAADPVEKAAQDIADRARADAVKRTGQYAEGFKAQEAPVVSNVSGNPRRVGEVYNSDRAAAAQEFGVRTRDHNVRREGNRTLRKAGEAAVGPPPAGKVR